MPQAKPPKDYLTAGQVKKLLGITDGMLYNFVENKALERVIPPGRKQGVYRRSQVEQLERDLKVFLSTRNEETTTFSKADKKDSPTLKKIGTTTNQDTQQEIEYLQPLQPRRHKNLTT